MEEHLLAKLDMNTDHPAEDSGEHPRYSDYYKNEGKVAERQRQRREEHLQRQSNAREEWLERRRNMDKDNEEEDKSHQHNPFALRRSKAKKKPYANYLMHSDWLVDIPQALSTEWTLVPSPRGRRCLVVAQNGKTGVYYKDGRFASSFKTGLPGGNQFSTASLTILDCICSSHSMREGDKYYVLDLLWWDQRMFTDTEFTCRQFFLRSKLEELAADSENAWKIENFVLLPSCPCSPEEMSKFMQQDFPYQLDGLLFFYNSAYYIPEQTPLVGWLKPWMLPEILGVPVPEHFTPKDHYSSKEYIDNFNKKSGHKSSAQIKAGKEAVMTAADGNGSGTVMAEEGKGGGKEAMAVDEVGQEEEEEEEYVLGE